MTTRTITGTIPAYPRATVRFRQLQAFVNASTTYLTAEYGAAIGSSGTFTIAVPVPDTGTVAYLIELPDGLAVAVFLGAGAATTLELLLAGAFASGSAPDVLIVLQSLIDTHALIKASTTVLGHVKIDGSTITIDGDGVISSSGGGGGGAPSGPAGGVLSGTYPNPVFAADMATQAELDAEASTRSSADSTLQTNITNEASTRAAADTTNAGNLTTHAALTTAAHGGIVASTDPRLTDSRAPSGAAGGVLGGTYPNPSFAADMATQAELDAEASTRAAADLLLAPLASPGLTGTPTAPTAADATSNTQIATTAFVHSLITALINASPATLDTLKELADAIGDDPNFATTVASSIATKLAKASNLSDLTNAATALTNLGLSANGSSLVTAANYAAMRTLLGLVIGTNVQAWDADLDAIAALTSAADKLPYATGAQAWALTTLTSFIRTLLDDADAATARGTLGAAPVAAKYIVQTADSELSAEQALGALASGYLKNTTTTGVLSVQATPIPIADGGTNATTAAAARASLGIDQDYAGGILIEHFPAAIGTNPTGPLGLVQDTSTGTVSAITTPDGTTISVNRLSTAGGATARACIRTPTGSFRFGVIPQRDRWRFQMPTLLDGTESGKIWIGYGDNPSGDPVDGAYLYWDNTQANFRFRTRSNSTETDTDSTLAPVAATWYIIDISVNAAATSAVFTLYNTDGTSVLATATLTTNIPSGAGRETGIEALIVKTAGTNARFVDVDFCRFAWGNAA